MRSVKYSLGLVVALSCLSLPAGAVTLKTKASPPPAPAVQPVTPPVFSWVGPYAGIHLGGLRFDGTYKVSAVGSESTNGTGASGGLLAGYNSELTKDWIAGVEVDVAGTTAHGNYHSGGPGALATTMDATSHARVRLGYEMGSSVLFLAGGGAAAYAIHHAPNWNTGTVIGNVVTGYSLGMGADHSFTPSMIGRIEYIYDNFGSVRFDYGAGHTIDSQYTTSTVRAALIWKL